MTSGSTWLYFKSPEHTREKLERMVYSDMSLVLYDMTNQMMTIDWAASSIYTHNPKGIRSRKWCWKTSLKHKRSVIKSIYDYFITYDADKNFFPQPVPED